MVAFMKITVIVQMRNPADEVDEGFYDESPVKVDVYRNDSNIQDIWGDDPDENNVKTDLIGYLIQGHDYWWQ